MFSDISLFIALFAGVVSFLSPCILPLIPGFLSYLAGTSLEESKNHQKEVFINSLFFVFGFSLVFSIIGILLSTLLSTFAFTAQTWMSRIGGAIIIFFGLYLTGLIQIKFLQQEHKIKIAKKFSSKYVTSFIFGAAFAAGWSPCVGAVLGTILGLAITVPTAAFILLMTYSFGLGFPFLIIGLFTAPASRFINKYGRFSQYINIVFGILLIIMGMLVFTQRLAELSNFDLLLNLFN